MVRAAVGAVTRADRVGEPELPALMVAYQRGNPEAVDELVRRISPAVFRYLSAGQANRSDAEDLLQDCWLRIHRARHTYRAPEPVLPWIFAIARHTRLDGFRRRQRRQSREMLVASPPEIVSPEPSVSPVASDELYRLLEALPDSQREVILMLKVSGMTLAEVARATSSTIGAIKQKAHRGYAKLRALLESRSE
jgi:RNA polymerase sigma-70 factor, ECF subfamily